MRTAVLDIDAHFGNGCSHHAGLDGEKSFTHLDASLRISQNDYHGYMDRLGWYLEKLRFFRPDLIEVNNGMDVLRGDPVGHGVLTLDEGV